MSKLLAVHDQMMKQAAQKEAEDRVVSERVEVLQKYAEYAEALMQKNYPNGHSEEDVVKLAELLIAHDIEEEEEQQKVAELDEAGRIMARAFVDEVNKAGK
jgi:hypothetical protein